MVDEKKVIERIKELEEEIAKTEITQVSRKGGLIELKRLLKDKKRRKLCF